MDSNGMGGFHILVIFAEPMSTVSVHDFGKRLVADFDRKGLDVPPEIFPDKPTWDHYGDRIARQYCRMHGGAAPLPYEATAVAV